MKLRSVSEIPGNCNVLLRMDLDVPMNGADVSDNNRLKKSILTIKLLIERECRIIIVGHRDRPKGVEIELSLKPVYAELMTILEQNGQNVVDSVFVEAVDDSQKIAEALETNGLIFMENLRFWPGERDNDDGFLEPVKEVCQFFVNDALGVAHRKEASVMLWQKMPTYYGLSFVEEIEKLEKIKENPQRPMVVILAGAKKDKLRYLKELEAMADKILVGGKLPTMMGEVPVGERVMVAKLSESGEDISTESIENFRQILARAKTVIWAGALGKFEVDGGKRSTGEVAVMVGQNESCWVLAGGDTVASVKGLGVEEKVELMASGGGVVLEYLTKGKLVAWE